LGKLVRSTAWKTISAATKANLASGDVGALTDMLGKLEVTYVSQAGEPQSPRIFFGAEIRGRGGVGGGPRDLEQLAGRRCAATIDAAGIGEQSNSCDLDAPKDCLRKNGR
jgi:hypothetical protein